jgi:hypothetical protein
MTTTTFGTLCNAAAGLAGVVFGAGPERCWAQGARANTRRKSKAGRSPSLAPRMGYLPVLPYCLLFKHLKRHDSGLARGHIPDVEDLVVTGTVGFARVTVAFPRHVRHTWELGH